MTTMVIVAHPDDETLYCGAYIAHASRSGEEVVTVTLAKGESGRTLGLCDASELAATREAELRTAADVLGIRHAEVYDLPDGRLAEHAAAATQLIRRALIHWRPAIVIAFGPNGINGHPDHVASHYTVLSALEHSPVDSRVLLMTDPVGYAEPARSGFLNWDQINLLRLAPTMTVQAGDALKIKLRAMGCYETQALSVTKRLRRYPEHILTEWFHELPG